MTQLLVHNSSGTELYNGPDSFSAVTDIEKTEGKVKNFAISANGKRIAWIYNGEVKVYEAPSWQRIGNLIHPKAQEICFSPQGNYLAILDLYGKVDGKTPVPNLFVYNVSGRKLLKSFFQKTQSNWEPQWTKDEQLMARMIKNEVYFFKADDLERFDAKKVLPHLRSFSLSPSTKFHNSIFFVPGVKEAPAHVQLYKYQNLSDQPASSKSLFKIDSVEIFWNTNCSAALILTTSEVDKGSSYYGQQMLFYLNIRGQSNRVTFSKEGNIRSVAWTKKGNEFFCVYGTSPSKTTLFNQKGDEVAQFGEGANNFVLPNPVGNIVLIGGLGNITSRFETWDIAERKCIAKVEFPDITHIEWSPCGQYILTSTCSPRLRVNNGYKIWHYTAVLVRESLHEELFRVSWIPNDTLANNFSIDYTPVKGIQSQIKTASKERYIPPSQRAAAAAAGGSVDTSKRFLSQRENQLEGVEPSKPTLSAQQMKQTEIENKKKEGKDEKTKKKKTAKAEAMDKDWRNERESAISFEEERKNTQKENRIKNIKKKLSVVEKIKKKVSDGKEPTANEKEKLSSEDKLLQELEKLCINS